MIILAVALTIVTTAFAQQADYDKLSTLLGGMVKERYAEMEATHRAPSMIAPLVTAS